MRRLSYFAWFVAAWPAVRLGGGRLGSYVFILLALMAVAAASQRRSFALNRTSREVIVLATLMVIGLGVGEIRGGAGPDALARIAVYWVGAVGPIIVANAFQDRSMMIRRLGLAFLAGTVASLLIASIPGTLPLLEAKSGFAGHKNQLAATLVMSLPLIALVRTRGPGMTRLLRFALGIVIVWGLNSAVSRSGMVAAVVIAMLTLLIVEPRRKNWARIAVALGFVFIVGAVATASTGGLVDELANSGAIARVSGEVNTTASDESRIELLNSGLSALDGPTALLGQGFTLERQPHNIFLGTWVAGGIVSIVGLVMLAMLALRVFLREAQQHHRRDVTTLALSLAVVGYLVVAFFNVLLWVPYVWAVIALFAASDDPRVSPITGSTAPTGRIRAGEREAE